MLSVYNLLSMGKNQKARRNILKVDSIRRKQDEKNKKEKEWVQEIEKYKIIELEKNNKKKEDNKKIEDFELFKQKLLEDEAKQQGISVEEYKKNLLEEIQDEYTIIRNEIEDFDPDSDYF